MKTKIRDYGIILLFTVIMLIPIFNSDFNTYIDDGIQHIARLMGTQQSIAENGIFSNIMSNFCNGFGYSWNIFYSPLTAYVPLIFGIFTDSFELMLKLFILLIVFVSGITMYEFVKRVTRNNFTALLASIIYVLVPYRFTDIYMRMAIAELTSFAFLPMVFHGMYLFLGTEQKNNKEIQALESNVGLKNSSEKNDFFKSIIILTIGATGLILTHTVIAMYTAIFCLIYLLVHIKRLKEKRVWAIIGISALLILLLSAFYIVPLIEHMANTDYEVFKPGRMERTDVMTYYKVDVLDLFYTPNGEMSFEIGLVTLIGLAFTPLVLKRIGKEYKKTYLFFLITGIVCVIMSLRFFPFESMPDILKMIQFTYRLLEFSSFFFAIVVAINYSAVIKNFRMRDVLILGAIALLLLVPLFRNINFEKKWSEDKLWPAVEVNENTGRVHAGCATFEYLPSKAFEHLDYIKQRENRVYILSGSADIQNENKNGTNMSFEVSNIERNTVAELPYIYYLGYMVEVVDEIGNMQKVDTFESENGFVAISIPKDAKTISVQYTGTVAMWISLTVSGVTLIGLIYMLLSCIFKSSRYSHVTR